MQSERRISAEYSCNYVKNKMIIGLGTGRTVKYVIEKLGKMVESGIKIKAISSSLKTEILAKKNKIPLTNLNEVSKIDLTIDGADEFDENLNLIKGGGGALFKEKILAYNSKKLIIVVDSDKKVKHLGKFPLPIEVLPFSWKTTANNLKKLNCKPKLRFKGKTPFKTENGNYILDCKFNRIENPKNLEKKINEIVGVVENGLFIDLADMVIMGKGKEVKIFK